MLHGTIVMIRHGEKLREKGADELTPNGMEQMRHAVTEAYGYGAYTDAVRILHSPTNRTMQGAQIIAEALGVDDIQPLIGAGVEWISPEQMTELIRVVTAMRAREKDGVNLTIHDWQRELGELGQIMRNALLTELLENIADLPDGSTVVVVTHEQLADGWGRVDLPPAREAQSYAYHLHNGVLQYWITFDWDNDVSNTLIG